MDDFDIIVSELATIPGATYVLDVILSSLLPGMMDGSMSEWPSPLVGFSADMTDDMIFFNRLKCFIVKPFSHIAYVYKEIADYQKVMEGVSFNTDAGVSIPLIITTVMGFEYPKTSHALTHYVGPVLFSSPPLIDKEMIG